MNDMNNKNMCVRIGIIGDAYVGKTSFVKKLADNTYDEKYNKYDKYDKYISTIGFDTTDIYIEHLKIKINICELTGNEKYKLISLNTFYSDINMFIIMFDLNNIDSFLNIKHYLKDIDKYANVKNSKKIIIIGNKNDNDNIFNIIDIMESLCESTYLQLKYYSISVKNMDRNKLLNVFESFFI